MFPSSNSRTVPSKILSSAPDKQQRKNAMYTYVYNIHMDT